jgi:hypothetical protein
MWYKRSRFQQQYYISIANRMGLTTSVVVFGLLVIPFTDAFQAPPFVLPVEMFFDIEDGFTPADAEQSQEAFPIVDTELGQVSSGYTSENPCTHHPLISLIW